MKDSLQVVIDLQQKYVELSEFKRVSCIDVNVAIPELKLGADKNPNQMNNCNNNFAQNLNDEEGEDDSQKDEVD